MNTVVLTDQKVIDFFTNEMVMAKIDGKQDTSLAAAYHIMGYPTLVLVDPQGAEVDRVVGYMPPDSLLIELTNYKNGIGTLVDLLAQAETNNDRSLAYRIAEKYHYRGGTEKATAWYNKVISAGDPHDSLSGECLLAIADVHRRNKEYDAALKTFTTVMTDFEGSMFAENAEVWKAIVYRQMGDTAAAIETFEQFVKHYPESEDVEYAQKQIAGLKGEIEAEK
ncbi:MAG: tetratricopeptide repeat protein [bacterium]